MGTSQLPQNAKSKERQLSYLAAGADDGFTASFHERLIFLSPINEGDFECNGCERREKKNRSTHGMGEVS